ncbi:MAG: hypothetical protein D6714_14045, partial [Bacteroidetes bacterium]
MNKHYPSMVMVCMLLFMGITTASTNDCIVFTFIPENEVIDCDDTPFFTLPMAVDNCCSDDVTLTKSDSSYTIGCETVYIRTWTASSPCGNSASIKTTITQKDLSAPIIILNDPQLVGLNSGDFLVRSCDEVFALGPNPVSVVDNCDPDPKLVLFDGLESGNCPQDGYVEILTCTWTATDDCGNESSFTFFVKFVDEKAPVIHCPDDQIAECDAADGDFGTATATDNCDDNLAITSIDNLVVINPCESVIERTWTATDHCWNESSCVQNIKLIDTTKPEIWCPDDLTLECDMLANPDYTGMASATDNCDDDVYIAWSDDTTFVTAHC